MDRKRIGRWGTVSTGLLLVLVCLMALVAEVASGEDTTVTGNVVDVTPPAAVTDLAVIAATYDSLTLIWTAPGDDGNLGTASEYDIRYSTSDIAPGPSWDSSTQCINRPTPQTAGSSESLIVDGLSPGTLYYFGLKAADEVPNWSDLSNIPSGRTLSGGGGGGGGIPAEEPTEVECPPGEVSTTGKATGGGSVTEAFVVESFDKRFILIIDEGVVVLTPDGTCPRCIGIHEMEQQLSLPEIAYLIGVMYDFVPDGTTFTPVATLIYRYDPADIPEGISAESLVIVCYDSATGEWIELDCVVDTEANTITAQVSQIYDLAVLYYVAPAPPPAPTPTPTPTPSPTPIPTPTPTPTPAAINWWLIGGIVALVAALVFVGYLFRKKLSRFWQRVWSRLKRLKRS